MTTSELFRRDPPEGKKEFSTHKGFTVIELMVVIAVLAIISSLALPSYRTLIEKRQVTSGAQQIAAFLSAAQLEAVKRNELVAVDYFHNQDLDNPQWCMGIVVGGSECDCMADIDSCIVDGTPRVMTMDNLNHAEAVVATEGDGAFVIDPVRGMMAEFNDVLAIQLLSKPENTYALNVVMGPTGRVSICSDTDRADTAVPGFDEC